MDRRTGALIACWFLALATTPTRSEVVPVSNPGELLKALQAADPGDTITLADGDYTDAIIQISRGGTPEQPVTVAAKTPGKAVLRGSSRVLIDATHVVVRGLLFTGESSRPGGVRGAAVEFTEKSANSRLTQCAIDGYDVAGGARDNWVNIWGAENRVDHCAFLNKTNVGELLRVRRDENKTDKHRIDHNYFGPRKPVKGNGGEQIQIGLKEQQFSESNSIVEYNLFEECDGEIELISVKSGGNHIRYNTMLRCASRVTLRHGDGSKVEGNFIVGDRKPDTGGVRVYGAKHTIAQNFITGTEGTGDQGGAISLHSGDDSDPRQTPANGVAATDCTVAHNTLLDNLTGIVIGSGKPVAPKEIYLAENLLVSDRGTLIVRKAKDATLKLEGNVAFGPELGIERQPGLTVKDPMLKPAKLAGYPYAKLPGEAPVGEQLFASGRLKPLARKDVGPAWLDGPAEAQ